jgi:TP901 family phage tail tape measure protein
MAVSVGTIEATLELRDRMSKQLKTAGKNLKTTGEKMRKVGTMARQAGTELTMGLTLPIVAIAGIATKSFMTFESSMNRVAATSGAVGQDFTDLTSKAEELGRTTQFTATQAAEAMAFFGLAGFNTNEILSAMPATLNLAAAGQLDMATSADIAAKVMRGYGMEAEELEGAVDVLTKAFTSANTDLRQLGQAFKYAGPVAKSAGIQFEETVAALSLMADAGFQATMGGTALRGSIARLLNPTKAMQRVIDRLGLTVTDSTGQLLGLDDIVRQLEPHAHRTGDILELFGLRAGPAMAALIARGADALSDLTQELERSEGTAKRIREIQMRGLMGAWLKMKSAWEGVSITLGRNLAPAMHKVADAVTRLATFIQEDMLPAWNQMGDFTQALILGVVALTAALGPLLIVSGTLTLTMSALATATGVASAVLAPWAIGIGLVVVAVGSLIYAWDDGRAALLKVIGVIGDFIALFVGTLWNTITDHIKIWAEFAGNIGEFFDTVALIRPEVKKFEKNIIELHEEVEVAAEKTEELAEAMVELDEEAEASVGPISRMVRWLNNWVGAVEDLPDVNRDVVYSLETQQGLLRTTAQEAQFLTEAWLDTYGTIATGGTAAQRAKDAYDNLDTSIQELVDGLRDGAIPAGLKLAEAIEFVGGVTSQTNSELESTISTLNEARRKFDATGEAVPTEIIQQLTRAMFELQMAQHKLIPLDMSQVLWNVPAAPTMDMGDGVPGLKMERVKTWEEIYGTVGSRMGNSLSTGLADVLKGVPELITGAFLGGGDMEGAYRAIGSQVGSVIGTSIGMAVGGPTGAMIGGGIGAMLGSFVPEAISMVGRFFENLTTGGNNAPTWVAPITKGFKEIADAGMAAGGIISGEFLKALQLAKGWAQGNVDAMAHFKEQTEATAVALASLFAPLTNEANLLNEAIESNAEALKSAGEATAGNTEALDKELEKLEELRVTKAEKLKSLEEETQALEANTDSLKASIKATEINRKANEFQVEIDEEIAESLERIAELRSKGLELSQQEIDLDTEKGTLAQNLIDLQKAGAEEIADLGLVTVAAFQSAVEASGSYIEAVKQTGPALQAVVDAQTALGVSSDNIALEELAHFQARIAENETLVRATEALDDTMLALSATGSLNAETMAAMERQGLRMFEKLVEAGFTEQQSLLMIQDFLGTTMEAHEKLGIPIDENTQKLIDQAKEAGALETKQKTGWKVVEDAIIKVVDKLQEMIDKIFGVNQEIRKIPAKIETEIAIRTQAGPHGSKAQMFLETGEWDIHEFQHGGVVTQPTLGMVGEAGPEAVIPLSQMSNEDLLNEVRGLRSELRLLPLHLRDAIILAG